MTTRLRRLTVQPRSSAVTLVQQLGGLAGDPLGVSHLVWVQLPVRTQEARVVNFLCRGGIVEPLF